MLQARMCLIAVIFGLSLGHLPEPHSLLGIMALLLGYAVLLAVLFAWLMGTPMRRSKPGPEDEIIDARIVYPDGSGVYMKVLVRRKSGCDIAYEPSVMAAPGGRIDLGNYQRRT